MYLISMLAVLWTPSPSAVVRHPWTFQFWVCHICQSNHRIAKQVCWKSVVSYPHLCQIRRASQRALAFPCSFLITATGHEVGRREEKISHSDEAVEPHPFNCHVVCWFDISHSNCRILICMNIMSIMSLKPIKTHVRLDLLAQKQKDRLPTTVFHELFAVSFRDCNMTELTYPSTKLTRHQKHPKTKSENHLPNPSGRCLWLVFGGGKASKWTFLMFQLRFFHKACYTWDFIRPCGLATLPTWQSTATVGSMLQSTAGKIDIFVAASGMFHGLFIRIPLWGSKIWNLSKRQKLILNCFNKICISCVWWDVFLSFCFFIGGTPVARRVDLQLFWMCVFQILQVPVWIGGAQSASSCCFFLLPWIEQHGRKALRNEGLHIW